jgi:hypothetical protein
MVKNKPPEAPSSIPLAERKRPPDSSITQTVISSPVPSKTNNRNLGLIRLEFTTRKNGSVINDEPLPKLVKKLVTHLIEADPTLEIHPIDAWPKQYTTVSSTVKPAPETDKHNTTHTKKNTVKITEKSPTITTSAALPTDRIGFDKYFQYTSDEHHPGEANKVVVRFYSAASKKLTELKNPITLDFLRENNMWVSTSKFETLRESTIGWIFKVNPLATNRDHYGHQLYDFLTTAVQSDPELGTDTTSTSATPNNKRTKHSESSAVAPVKPTPTCPPFSIIVRNTGVMCPPAPGKKPEYLPTKALMIRCKTVHAERLQNILAAACDKGLLHDAFIPHSIKQTEPKLYQAAIKAQLAFIASSTVISVEGFSAGGLDLPYYEDATAAADTTTLRSMIMESGLFSRIDETVSSFRSAGCVFFATDFARLAAAEEFIDTTLKAYFDSLDWEQKESLLLPDSAYPARILKRRPPSNTIASYITKLSSSLPPLATVEFSSAPAPPSSNTNAWTKKSNPVFFHDKPKSKSKTRSTFTTDSASLAESTNTAPTLATQLSHTEALIDRKFATFRTEMEMSHKSQILDTFERLVAPIIEKFDRLSTQMEKVLAQSSRAQEAPPSHASTTTVPPLHHHTAHHDPHYANREPDTVSVHSQSPGRTLPPHGHSYPPHIPYPQPPPHHMDPRQSHAPPPNFNPFIYNESNPHPDFAAQHQHQHQPYYNTQPQNHPHNYTQHQFAANGSIPHPTNPTDLSMAELHHTMTDPNQSIINHTMTEPNTTLPLDVLPDILLSPPAAPKGILKNTSDQAPSGGASK